MPWEALSIPVSFVCLCATQIKCGDINFLRNLGLQQPKLSLTSSHSPPPTPSLLVEVVTVCSWRRATN